MARPIVLSNGELHVGLNSFGLVHDFYFPYVGLENHAAGANLRHKIGVYVDDSISWLDEDPAWVFDFSYPHDSLIGHITATNVRIGVLLEFDDAVDVTISALLRSIHVVNLGANSRRISLFMHQAFAIGDSRSNTDTGQYLPDSDAILHYRGQRAFVIGGLSDGKPFDQYTIGVFGIEGHEGTFRDAEDGELSGSAVEHGRVDSTIRFALDLAAHDSARVHYWIAAGTSLREALYVHRTIQSHGVDSLMDQTCSWWRDWLEPAKAAASKVPEEFRDLFIKSAMIIKSQIDKRGAVIASTDSSLLNYSRDSYSYAWPRDGAATMWPLIRMGYVDEPYRFFEFSKKGLHPGGFLMHKYRADGALGSSWHPYLHPDGTVAPPIQEDETALVVFVFSQFYEVQKDAALLTAFYDDMIVPMADFLAEHVSDKTGLPKSSYDLWEQSFLTSTYSTSVTYAALLAASDLAALQQDSKNAVKWRAAASDIKEHAADYLYNKDRQVFYRGFHARQDGQIDYDDTVDVSSFFGAFLYGLFDATSDEVSSSYVTMSAVFNLEQTHMMPRHENDDYRRQSDNINGNYWHITTLWLAQYLIAMGQREKANELIRTVRDAALSTGMLSEQIDPRTDQSVSPAPLTWSHAEYLSTLLDIALGE